jgi:hypothetical protein
MNRKTNEKVRGRKTLRQKTFSREANQRPGKIGYGEKPIAINLSRYLLQPPSIYVKLRYNIEKHVINSPLASASYSWYANGVYDVDPAVASTAVPGFVEWMSLYRTSKLYKSQHHRLQ